MLGIFPFLKAQFFDSNGDPLASGKLYSYAAGTLTPKATYADIDGAGANANPLILDSAGRGNVYLASGAYKFVLKTAADVTVWTIDNIQDSEAEISSAIEEFGTYVDGNTLFDSALAAAVATGKPIRLRAGRTYFFSAGVSVVSGCRLYCPDGIATIKLKTGAGGFNVVSLTGDRQQLDRCFFSCSNVDDVGLENIRFTTDGVAESVIYPVRTSSGLGSKGATFRNLTFVGFKVGEMIGIGSAGEGSYCIENIFGLDCGASQGNTYWGAGTPQWTLFALDNDVTGGVYSEPGFASNLRVKDCLFTGDALTNYGQQTDCFNHVGMDSNKHGPVILGIYADGIGEVVDIFGSYCVVKGIHARNAYFVAKLIHGAQHNLIEVDSVESCGEAVVILNGSTQSVDHTQYNTVRVGAVKGVGTVQSPSGDAACVVIGGAGFTKKPKFNVVTVDNVLGDGVNMDYVVRDGGADNDLQNIVEVGRAAGWAIQFCNAPPDNVMVRYKQSTDVLLVLPGNQSLTTTVPATIDFSTVVRDRNSEAVTASDKVRCKFPGRKSVSAQVRLTGHADQASVTLEILLNASVVRTIEEQAAGGNDSTFMVKGIINIGEDQVNGVGADISIRITVTSAGTLSLTASNSLSFLEVVDLD